MAKVDRTEEEIAEFVRGIVRSVRDSNITPRQADETCLGEGLSLLSDGWRDRHDITTNSVWWLPQAVLFYAWQDLGHTREQWERFALWEDALWRDPTDERQMLSLEEAEALFISDLSAGIVRAFAASGDGPIRPIPCEVWDKSRVQRWRGSAAIGEDGVSRFVGAFVLRHEVVPLLISEPVAGSQSLMEPVRRERVEQPATKRGGGRPTTHDWAGAAGFATAHILENDYPPVESDLAQALAAWFAEERGKAPDPRDVQRFVAEIYKHRRPTSAG